MRTSFASKSSGPGALGYIDACIEGTLYALLAFMPFAFGVVAAWSEAIVVGGAAVIAVGLVARQFVKSDESPWTWAYVPILLFILVAIFQITPLPAALVGLISPHTLSLKSSLLSDVPGASESLKHLTLSFYPLATRHDLVVIFVATVVFVTVLNVYRQAGRMKRLLVVIAAIGGAVGLLALLQNLTGTDKIYWWFAAPKGARSGPFVNYSHYAQFMNLSMGAMLALLLTLTTKSNANDGRDPAFWFKAALMGGLIIGVATILLSMSRGGVISMLAGFLLLGTLLIRRGMNRGFGWAIGLSALVALVVVVTVGFDSFYDKMATFKGADPSSGRMQIYRDILASARKFPVFGMGLGAHKMTYPMLDGSTNPLLLEYADSDYFQLLEEMGVLGLVLALAFACIVWKHFVRCIGSASSAKRMAAAGLGYGLLAVMTQSMTDYGQHLPSIACLTAVTCALLINVAKSGRRTTTPLPLVKPPAMGLRFARFAMPAGLVGVMAFAFVFTNNARLAAASASRAAEIAAAIQENATGAEGAYSQVLEEADDAVAHAPLDVEARYWQCWYRWNFVSRHTNPKTGMIVLTDDDLLQVRRIVADMHQARLLCPTYGPVAAVVGQWELFVLNEAAGADHVRLGYRLAPNNAEACFTAALVAATQGGNEETLKTFGRYLLLAPENMPRVADACIERFERPDLALNLAGDNPQRLLNVIGALHAGTIKSDLRTKTLAQAIARCKTAQVKDGVPADVFASIGRLYRQDKQWPQALANFRARCRSTRGMWVCGWRWRGCWRRWARGIRRLKKHEVVCEYSRAWTRRCSLFRS